jgi:hypothetical protein
MDWAVFFILSTVAAAAGEPILYWCASYDCLGKIQLKAKAGWTKSKGAHENFPSFFTYGRKKIFDGSARFMQF